MTRKSRGVLIAVVIAAVLGIGAIVAISRSSGSSHKSGSSSSSSLPGSTGAGGHTSTTVGDDGASGSNATIPAHPIGTKPTGVVTVATGSPYGQSPSTGACARWKEKFSNGSNVAVARVTWSPGRTIYHQGSKESKAATPAPADLAVRLAPGKSATLEFMTCTVTPAPAHTTALQISPPSVLTWQWANGWRGRAKLG